MNEPAAVVLGVGSPLMGDDGLGVAVVDMLRERWEGVADLALLDGGTWGMRILPFIESARRLLIVDAIRNGGAPGTFVRLEKEEIPRRLRQKVSPHQIELGEVLAVAELRSCFPEEVMALGIEPAVVELKDGLSDTVTESVPRLVREIEAQLSTWGYEPSPGGGVAPGEMSGVGASREV